MSRCKSCGAPLVFALSPRGKWVPFDAPPVGEKAPRVWVLSYPADLDGRARAHYVETFRPHWEHCPGAAGHRKPREREPHPNAVLAEAGYTVEPPEPKQAALPMPGVS